jgi:hypothetical protein
MFLPDRGDPLLFCSALCFVLVCSFHFAKTLDFRNTVYLVMRVTVRISRAAVFLEVYATTFLPSYAH